jgi:hypothetical protein
MEKMTRKSLRRIILEELETSPGFIDKLTSFQFGSAAERDLMLNNIAELDKKLDVIIDRLDDMERGR